MGQYCLNWWKPTSLCFVSLESTLCLGLLKRARVISCHWMLCLLFKAGSQCTDGGYCFYNICTPPLALSFCSDDIIHPTPPSLLTQTIQDVTPCFSASLPAFLHRTHTNTLLPIASWSPCRIVYTSEFFLAVYVCIITLSGSPVLLETGQACEECQSTWLCRSFVRGRY